MERDTEHLRRLCSQHCGPVADGRDTIESQAPERIERFGNAIELHGNGAIGPGILKHVTAIARQREIQPHAPGCFGKNADLVTRSGGK
jgi:hypothetical protein